MNIRQIRTYLGWFSFYLLPLGLVVLSLFFQMGEDFYSELGGLSLALLTGILFLTPVWQITGWKIFQLLRALRRELGVASFWFFAFHTGGLIYLNNLYNVQDYLDPSGYLFWGAVAGFGMLILGLTSNDVSVKILKRNWKTVQWIAIPTFFFALAHASIADDGTIWPAVGMFVLYIIARYTGRWVERQRKLKKAQQQIKKDPPDLSSEA